MPIGDCRLAIVGLKKYDITGGIIVSLVSFESIIRLAAICVYLLSKNSEFLKSNVLQKISL